MDKKQLRKICLERRNAMNEEERKEIEDESRRRHSRSNDKDDPRRH